MKRYRKPSFCLALAHALEISVFHLRSLVTVTTRKVVHGHDNWEYGIALEEM